jgi:hypothetical protein
VFDRVEVEAEMKKRIGVEMTRVEVVEGVEKEVEVDEMLLK